MEQIRQNSFQSEVNMSKTVEPQTEPKTEAEKKTLGVL